METVFFYVLTSASGCFGPGGFLQLVAAAVSDSLWHDITGMGELSAPAETFYLRVGYFCSGNCPNSQVNFDDLVLEKVVPTAVSVSSIRAGRTRSGNLVRWRTVAENDTLGFNLYRQQKGRLVKLNRALIPSVFGGTTTGHPYSWLDHRAPRTSGKLSYRLQAVSLSGKRSWVGSTDVAR